MTETDLLIIESILIHKCGLTRRDFHRMNVLEAAKMAEAAIARIRQELEGPEAQPVNTGG